MTVNKDELKVHIRTDCTKAVSALDNCIMAGAFMPLPRANCLEFRSESLKENARSRTVAHLSRPDLRISGPVYTAPVSAHVWPEKSVSERSRDVAVLTGRSGVEF